MAIPSARSLDAAAEARWPRWFRFDLRQTLWVLLGFQVSSLALIVIGSPWSAGPLIAGSLGLVVRALLESKPQRHHLA
jgi:hypothetical protein